MVLGIGHQRGGAQRVADLVDVAALEVLEHRNGAHPEGGAPVRRHAGVDAPAAVVLTIAINGRLGARVGPRGAEPPCDWRCGGRTSSVRATPATARAPSRGRRPLSARAPCAGSSSARQAGAGAPRAAAVAGGGERSDALQARAAHHAGPLPASNSAANWAPIMKRRKKRSVLPGTTSMNDPNVVARTTAGGIPRARPDRARPAPFASGRPRARLRLR